MSAAGSSFYLLDVRRGNRCWKSRAGLADSEPATLDSSPNLELVAPMIVEIRALSFRFQIPALSFRFCDFPHDNKANNLGAET